MSADLPGKKNRLSFPIHSALLGLVWLLAAPFSHAGPPVTYGETGTTATANVSEEPVKWEFNFLPKSFQQNPRLDLTVITEVTAEGKQLPEVTAQHPAYYLIQSAGYHQSVGAPAGDETLPQTTLEAFVRRSLATRSYHPASPEKPPSLVLIYSWGVYDSGANMLKRAALIGGQKFRNVVRDLLEEDRMNAEMAQSLSMRHMIIDGQTVPPIMGPEQLAFINPFKRFQERSPKNWFLMDQFYGDIYYVIVSAYSAEALLRKQRVLLWRTRMTVSPIGVSQTDSLPTLIKTAAPYFGREMSEPATLTPRVFPETRVKLGPLEFPDEKPAAPVPPTETAPQK